MQKIDLLLRGMIGEEWTNRILYQTYSIAGHEVTLPMIILFVICVILFVLIIKNLKAAIFSSGGGSKRAQNYIECMSNTMKECKNLKVALKKMVSEYQGNKKEIKVLQDALYYLDHSIAKDYRGALLKIEDFYKSDEVEELHGRILGGEFKDD